MAGPDGRYDLTAKTLPSGGGQASFWMHRKNQPRLEFTSTWIAQRNRLDLKVGLTGGKLMAHGRVDLHPPFPVDLLLVLDGAEVEELARWFLPPEQMPRLAGRVEGEIRL